MNDKEPNERLKKYKSKKRSPIKNKVNKELATANKSLEASKIPSSVMREYYETRSSMFARMNRGRVEIFYLSTMYPTMVLGELKNTSDEFEATLYGVAETIDHTDMEISIKEFEATIVEMEELERKERKEKGDIVTETLRDYYDNILLTIINDPTFVIPEFDIKKILKEMADKIVR